MPIFLYRNPNTDEIIEVIQSVHESHTYKDNNGLEWLREFTIPNASIDTKLPENGNQFVERTKVKRGNVGNLFDYSKECSEKREKIYGEDKLKEQYYKNYSKIRHGRDHPNRRKEKLEKITKEPITLKLK